MANIEDDYILGNRRFVNGFADIAAPLHRLADLKSQFNWTAECEAAFK